MPKTGCSRLSALIFVEPAKSERARQALRQALGGKRLEYLLALLTFIRAAHYWTMVHPGLEIEDDVRELMARTRNSLPCSCKTPILLIRNDLLIARNKNCSSNNVRPSRTARSTDEG